MEVLLDDGTRLSCDDTGRFSDAPHGPLLLGADGSIAIYATHKRGTDGSIENLEKVSDENGYLVTCVPANRIKLLNIRHLKRP